MVGGTFSDTFPDALKFIITVCDRQESFNFMVGVFPKGLGAYQALTGNDPADFFRR